jgi:ABC-type arginine/histidine transport system permease subunit
LRKLRQKTTTLGYVLTIVGIFGVIVSLVTEQSDYDPVAFVIAAVSILVAVIGISLIFKIQTDEQPNERPL